VFPRWFLFDAYESVRSLTRVKTTAEVVRRDPLSRTSASMCSAKPPSAARQLAVAAEFGATRGSNRGMAGTRHDPGHQRAHIRRSRRTCRQALHDTIATSRGVRASICRGEHHGFGPMFDPGRQFPCPINTAVGPLVLPNVVRGVAGTGDAISPRTTEHDVSASTRLNR